MFRFFDLFNEFAGLLLFFAYLYQVFFTLYGLIRRPSPRCAPSSPTAEETDRLENYVLSHGIRPSPICRFNLCAQ